MAHEQIKELNKEIYLLKDDWSKELDTVNYYYWPIIAKDKRNVKNHVWYFSLACCLLFAIIFWLVFEDIQNEYWIGGSLGIGAVVLFFTTFRMIKTLKTTKKDKEEWQKNLVNANKMQEEIASKCDEATKLMLASLPETDEVKALGSSYDDILEYYNNWVETGE